MGLHGITLVWAVVLVGLTGYLTFQFTGDDRRTFLPGATSDGHHQIEMVCDACHTPFGGVLQDACLNCHQAELEIAQDSHDEIKFNDPRFASDLARLDVRRCVTCHTEHRPEITEAMGVTLPADLCYHCHEAAGEERPTHQELGFETCAAAGCHNYHDNRALYADFLAQHGTAEVATFPGLLPARMAWVAWDATGREPLSGADADGPANSSTELINAWAGSAHASAGVTCTDCHAVGNLPWNDYPSRDVCAACHVLEHGDYLSGKHGMRESVGLDPMSSAMARLRMHPETLSTALDCGVCHDVHAVDVRRAAVDACLGCHSDEHTTAYAESPHFGLWQSELAGEAAPGSGVSCATCHLPRETRRVEGADRIVVQHNQNANLRPSEKMIRDVCLNCHSLALAIDALADPEQVRRNFVGPSAVHVPSIDMALSQIE
ncbi:MAG: cytochrome c3 family protein [Rhodospirillaceae bacterium]|nr:cytochrome c3 family protein [Rhodospirillaceae bacterium]